MSERFLTLWFSHLEGSGLGSLGTMFHNPVTLVFYGHDPQRTTGPEGRLDEGYLTVKIDTTNGDLIEGIAGLVDKAEKIVGFPVALRYP